MPGSRYPCPCPRCNGALVSRRTLQRHASHAPAAPILSFSAWSQLLAGATTSQPSRNSLGSDVDDVGHSPGSSQHNSRPSKRFRLSTVSLSEDEPWNAPSGEAGSTTTSKKSGKLMVASSTALSARNLFAIEYLKEHPVTTKYEFKKIWDNIASETKKKYEALSKERKSAARLPAATTANGSNAVTDLEA